MEQLFTRLKLGASPVKTLPEAVSPCGTARSVWVLYLFRRYAARKSKAMPLDSGLTPFARGDNRIRQT
jgi:hypothetical protein